MRGPSLRSFACVAALAWSCAPPSPIDDERPPVDEPAPRGPATGTIVVTMTKDGEVACAQTHVYDGASRLDVSFFAESLVDEAIFHARAEDVGSGIAFTTARVLRMPPRDAYAIERADVVEWFASESHRCTGEGGFTYGATTTAPPTAFTYVVEGWEGGASMPGYPCVYGGDDDCERSTGSARVRMSYELTDDDDVTIRVDLDVTSTFAFQRRADER